MDRDELKATLKALHEQLERGEPIDPDVRAMLQQLSEDIDRKAVKPSPDSPDSLAAKPDEKESILDRLLSVTEEFEESHPHLAQAIGNVASALSRIGI